MSQQPIDIRPNDLSIVQQILRDTLPTNVKVWVFGSRATWTTKDSSDLDLAIDAVRPLTRQESTSLAEAFDESSLPYKVDVVDMHTVSDTFKAIIERDMVALETENNWQLTSIDELKRQIAIGPFGSRMKSDCYVDDGIRVIRGTNLMDGRELSGNFVFITPDKAKELGNCNLIPGDLVFPHRGSIGEVGIVPNDEKKYILSSSLMKLSCDYTKADPLFIYYYFKSIDGRNELLKNASQVGTPGIGQPLASLKSIKLKLPPLPEQKAIASVLRALDDKIELSRQTCKTLEAMSQALFKSWFVDFDPVHAKIYGRQPYGMDAATAALFPNSLVESELGLIPKGWNIISVYDLGTYINGASYRAFEPNEERRGLPIIKIAELKSGVTAQTRYSAVNMPEKYRITSGDILFSWSGNPDTSIDTFVWIHGQAWLNQHIFRVVPNNIEERSFVLIALKHLKPVFAEIARDKQTTGLGHVTIADLKRYKLVMPPTQILDHWNKIVTSLLKQAFITESKNQTIINIRDYLLPKLISGEVSTE